MGHISTKILSKTQGKNIYTVKYRVLCPVNVILHHDNIQDSMPHKLNIRYNETNQNANQNINQDNIYIIVTDLYYGLNNNDGYNIVGIVSINGSNHLYVDLNPLFIPYDLSEGGKNPDSLFYPNPKYLIPTNE